MKETEVKESYYGLRLSVLPTLSSNATELDCSRNNLERLPELPVSLHKITCFGNRLASLPRLAGLAKLKVLDCAGNYIRELPDLPDGMYKLCCSGNKVRRLPELPDSLRVLSCSSNPLTLAGVRLPDGLEYLHCDLRQLEGARLPASLKTLSTYDMFNCLTENWPWLPEKMDADQARMLVPLAKELAVSRLLEGGYFELHTARMVLSCLLSSDAAGVLTRWHGLIDMLHLLPDTERHAAERVAGSVCGLESAHVL